MHTVCKVPTHSGAHLMVFLTGTHTPHLNFACSLRLHSFEWIGQLDRLYTHRTELVGWIDYTTIKFGWFFFGYERRARPRSCGRHRKGVGARDWAQIWYVATTHIDLSITLVPWAVGPSWAPSKLPCIKAVHSPRTREKAQHIYNFWIGANESGRFTPRALDPVLGLNMLSVGPGLSFWQSLISIWSYVGHWGRA